MATRSIIDAATRAQVYLERLKAGSVRDYDKAQAELRQAVMVVMAGIEADNLSDLSERELRSILRDLQDAQTGVTQAAMDNLNAGFAELADYVAASEAIGLTRAVGGLARFAAPTGKLAYERALAEPLQATGQLLESFTKDWTGPEAARVADLVRKGWAQGRTTREVTTDIVGTRKNRYQDGALATTRRKAHAVVNTATQHVANAARMATYEENDDLITGYKFVATLDNKTTPICRSLDGRIFEPGKGPVPPLHVNCRSTTVPVLDDEYAFLGKGATRSAQKGPVDADLTYYDWLKTQPAKFQNDAIGPVRGKLLRDGGLTADQFARLNLGRDFEPLTLDQMREIEPEAFRKAGLN